jgi:hypothetical protein
MPWRYFLRMKDPDPVASERADVVTKKMDRVATDLEQAVVRVKAMAERLEGLGG